MRRFHVHVSVQDIQQSVGFYSVLFGCAPTVLKEDYAKWMLDDPRLNFAISKRGADIGINHLGLQFDDEAELASHGARIKSADAAVREEREAPCCYSESNKHWINDPQGIPWEAFHALRDIPVYGSDSGPQTPTPRGRRVIPIKTVSAEQCCRTTPESTPEST